MSLFPGKTPASTSLYICKRIRIEHLCPPGGSSGGMSPLSLCRYVAQNSEEHTIATFLLARPILLIVRRVSLHREKNPRQ